MNSNNRDDPSASQPFRPNLDDADQGEASRRSALPVTVVHEAILQEGEDELGRPAAALAWSGLAAGLSMGFSFVAEALLRSYLPSASWAPLLTKLGYCVGFLIVILGRQQLFTENTLTVILPLMARRNSDTLLSVLRLWGIVFAANVAGALLFALVAGHSQVFAPPVRHAFTQIGQDAMKFSFFVTLLKAIFAGWLIALMVWMLPVAETNRVAVIIIITYLVGLGSFSHIIVGAVEALYLAVTGAASWSSVLGGFMLPTLLGNIIGGVSLVAALNHAQTIAGHDLKK